MIKKKEKRKEEFWESCWDEETNNHKYWVDRIIYFDCNFYDLVWDKM